jgi:hypothetical protein
MAQIFINGSNFRLLFIFTVSKAGRLMACCEQGARTSTVRTTNKAGGVAKYCSTAGQPSGGDRSGVLGQGEKHNSRTHTMHRQWNLTASGISSCFVWDEERAESTLVAAVHKIPLHVRPVLCSRGMRLLCTTRTALRERQVQVEKPGAKTRWDTARG